MLNTGLRSFKGESVKFEVLELRLSPGPQVLKAIKADINSLADELVSLKVDRITTAKSMRKRRSSGSFVEEQQFPSRQEEFTADLQDNHEEPEGNPEQTGVFLA